MSISERDVAAMIADAIGELEDKIAPVLAEGLREAGARPTVERGGTDVKFGTVTASYPDDGYAEILLDGQQDAVPIMTLGTLLVNQKAMVLSYPPAGLVAVSPVTTGTAGQTSPPGNRLLLENGGEILLEEPGGGNLQLEDAAVNPPPTALPDRAVKFEPVIQQDGLWLSSCSAGFSWAQDFTFTDPLDDTLYALWYGSSANPIIGKKATTDKRWRRFDLSRVDASGTETGTTNVAGNPLDAPARGDGHNYTVFGISGEGDGIIHIVGNSHSAPMHYMRSVNPYDITDWTGPLAMVGSNETQATYPMFHRLTTGELLFVYRSGSSGDGDHRIRRWTSGAWTDLGQIIDGTTGFTGGDTASAYPASICFDADDNMHVLFDWRARHEAAGQPSFGDQNHGWYYFKVLAADLRAGGTITNVYRSDGTAITLPVAPPDLTSADLTYSGNFTSAYSSTHWAEQVANFPDPYVINDSAPGQPEPCDRDGYPHCSFMNIDAGDGTVQHWHLYQNGTGWHADQITGHGPWTPAASFHSGTPAGDAARMRIINTKDGHCFAVGNWPAEGKRGSLWCYDLTPNAIDTAPFRISDLQDGDNFHFDFHCAATNNKLRILVVNNQKFYLDPGDPHVDVPPGFGTVGAPGGPNLDPPAGLLGLLDIDLAQINLLKNRQVTLPRIKVVSESSGGNIIVPANTTTFTAAGDLLEFQRDGKFVADSAINNTAAGGSVTANRSVFKLGPGGFALGNHGSGNQPVIVVGNDAAGGILFARMHLLMRVGVPQTNYDVSGGGWVAASIIEDALQNLSPNHTQTYLGSSNATNIAVCINAVTQYGSPTLVNTNIGGGGYDPFTVFSTPWIALRRFTDPGTGDLGRIRLGARTGANAGTILAVTLQLGQLDY